MILLWFILGICLILGIARYNESNKLFWTLLFAFVMGFAGTKMVLQIVESDEQDEICINQTNSTQVLKNSLTDFQYFITNDFATNNVVTAQNLVGQGLYVNNDTDIILSEVYGGIRDQPINNLLKPPEQGLLTKICFNTS